MAWGLAGLDSGQQQTTEGVWGRPSLKAHEPHEPPGVEGSLKLWVAGAASAAFQVSLTCPLFAPLPTCRGSVQCT